MRNYIEGLPHHHSKIRGFYAGVSDGGYNFDLEVHTEKTPLNTHGRAKKMMEARVLAAKRAQMAGKPLGVYEHVRVSENSLEEETRIMLRVATPGKVHKIPIRVNADGSYSDGAARSRSLQQIVREATRRCDRSFGSVRTLAKVR